MRSGRAASWARAGNAGTRTKRSSTTQRTSIRIIGPPSRPRSRRAEPAGKGAILRPQLLAQPGQLDAALRHARILRPAVVVDGDGRVGAVERPAAGAHVARVPPAAELQQRRPKALRHRLVGRVELEVALPGPLRF